MKKCQFCAELIQDEATYCKYCKSDLLALPKAESTGSLSKGVKIIIGFVVAIFGILFLWLLYINYFYL